MNLSRIELPDLGLAPRAVVCLALWVALGACAGPKAQAPLPSAYAPQDSPDVYPLDDEPRERVGGRCPQVQLVDYAGDVIAYHRPLRVNPFFKERLQQFELVVLQVSRRVYGRAPRAIRHFGAYACRAIKGRARLSEHALGNALDVWGFDFDPDPSQPSPLDQGFQIVLLKDWSGGSPLRDHHARFLRELVRELAARPDIFRGILGPGAPDHDDHFHFDVGRSRFIKVYE